MRIHVLMIHCACDGDRAIICVFCFPQDLLRSKAVIFHLRIFDVFPSVLRSYAYNPATNPQTRSSGISHLG